MEFSESGVLLTQKRVFSKYRSLFMSVCSEGEKITRLISTKFATNALASTKNYGNCSKLSPFWPQNTKK